MENEFKQVMSERSDKDLIKIITIDRGTYQPIAIEAAESEIKYREIDIDNDKYREIKENYRIEKENQDYFEEQIKNENKENSNKNMIYGALWCVGGIVATVSDIGYIFWGAILFGGIQFFNGMTNAYKP